MIELELESHVEFLADPAAEDYQRIASALKTQPLYHQWKTYQARDADIIVNSYNTGTGKTKAALLRLLDLDDAFKKDRYSPANVLFIAPTNELLRQHEDDIQQFVDDNRLSYAVLRLDAATIRDLGRQHLGEKFLRQGDRLHQMLQDPGSVLLDKDGHHLEGRRPYVLVINPDIFYYALYGLGNPHDQKVLFRDFVSKFSYIVLDEFHYYNAKQLANFLFFLTLLREWHYFDKGLSVCLLTATPVKQVKDYLHQLHLQIEYIEPGNEPVNSPTIPALAPIHLRLYSAEALENGLVTLATNEKSMVLDYLEQGKHGAFISSALWRINWLYQEYGGKANSKIGRLTGAEQTIWRTINKLADLLMATPTVDIGYNFVRPGKKRQSIDFLFFDARSSDEFIQRLGRAGRVLGKEEQDIASNVWAVVPDELVVELDKRAEKPTKRHELNDMVNAFLPQKNSIYAYISSGAIAEAFLPLYTIHRSLPKDAKESAERLYVALLQAYGTTKASGFNKLMWNTQRYLKLKSLLPTLLKEANNKNFTFGPASVAARTMDEQHEVKLDELASINEAIAHRVEMKLQQNGIAGKAQKKRLQEIAEYYATEARFNFRDNFQPPLALAHDPEGLLATSEYTIYSALHIAQNYIANWFPIEDMESLLEKVEIYSAKDVKLYCELKMQREQRLHLHFTLSQPTLTRKQWEAHYCSTLSAICGFQLSSDDGPIAGDLNEIFAKNYITFYAVLAQGPEALALARLQKNTALFATPLRVDFASEGEQEYIMIVGTAALLTSYEKNVMQAKYVAHRVNTHGSHIFDWDEKE